MRIADPKLRKIYRSYMKTFRNHRKTLVFLAQSSMSNPCRKYKKADIRKTRGIYYSTLPSLRGALILSRDIIVILELEVAIYHFLSIDRVSSGKTKPSRHWWAYDVSESEEGVSYDTSTSQALQSQLITNSLNVPSGHSQVLDEPQSRKMLCSR